LIGLKIAEGRGDLNGIKAGDEGLKVEGCPSEDTFLFV
jgi:hypothetical protein